jgi:hypothetical protein
MDANEQLPTPAQLANILSKEIGESITEDQIVRDIADGAPVLPGNRVNILLYAAWILKNDHGQRRTRSKEA